MIISVTPNTAIDYTLRVPEFTLGRTIRAHESAWGMGGKAADASWILGHWGIKNLVMGFAAGLNGQRMDRMLRERGCETDFVWVGGETRLNTVICMRGEHSTFTSSTLEVSPQHLAEFNAKYRHALETATCVIVGGSLPKGVSPVFFKEAIHLARMQNLPVIFDSSGASLKVGLDAHPTVIKPNLAELHDLTESEMLPSLDTLSHLPRIQAVYNLAQQVQSRYHVAVVSTLGDEGALAIFDEAHYWISPLKVEVVSAAGAGDAVLAGLALAYSQQMPIEEGLRIGFAIATAVLLTPATADFSPDAARKYLPRIKVQKIMPGTSFVMEKDLLEEKG